MKEPARRALVPLALAVLLASACSSDDDGDDGPADDAPGGAPNGDDGFDVAFTSLDCAELTDPQALEAGQLGDPAVSCGRVTVPANWDVPDGETIDLALYRIAPSADSPAPDPVVALAGGPGQSGASLVSGFLEGGPLNYLRERSETIVVDQRGTGYSTPSLLCPELDASVQGSDGSALGSVDEQLAGQRDAIVTCAERLVGENVTLGDYTTINNARDIDAVRRALGVDEWNLLGGSYGTTLALTVLRERPEGVRSVVLDSAAPLQVATVVAGADEAYAAGYWPLSQIVTNCTADADCAENVGDIRVPIEVGLARLASAPIGAFTAESYLEVLAENIGNPGLPGIITLIAEGSEADIREALGPDGPGQDGESGESPTPEVPPALAPLVFDATVMYAAIICAEELPYSASSASPDLSDDFQQTTRDIVETAALQAQVDTTLCERLGVPPADPVQSRAVASDVPTLVLAGDTDVQTPPAWGAIAAESLSASQYVEFPAIGHIVADEGIGCADDLVRAFLDAPEAAVDRTCVDALPLVDYVTGT